MWPPGYKSDIRRESEQRFISGKCQESGHALLSESYHQWRCRRLPPNIPRSYHNKWPSCVVTPTGSKKHWETKPSESKEEAQPCYQTHFSLLTLSEFKMPKGWIFFIFIFLLRVSYWWDPNKSHFFSVSSWLSVVSGWQIKGVKPGQRYIKDAQFKAISSSPRCSSPLYIYIF